MMPPMAIMPMAIIVAVTIVVPVPVIRSIAVVRAIAVVVAVSQRRSEEQSANDPERETASVPAVMVATPPVGIRLRGNNGRS